MKFDREGIGIPGLEETQLLAVLNQAVLEYHGKFEQSGEPSSILSKETGYTLVADTAAAAAIASGATSITGDSFASFGSSGAIAIWDNERADYALFGANNMTTTLSSVTGVSFAHEDNDRISLLYALPSDFSDFRSTEGNESGVTVDGVPYHFTSGPPTGRYFHIYDTGTTKYLHFPEGLTGDVFVTYNAAPTVVDDVADSVDIPVRDEWYAVNKVCAYCAPLLEQDPSLYEARALQVLSNSMQRRNVGKRMHFRPMRSAQGFSRSQIFD